MSDSSRRVRITCPQCGGFIASAPDDHVPTGDLVCPSCGEIVQGQTRVDRIVETVKRAIAATLGASRERNKPK